MTELWQLKMSPEIAKWLLGDKNPTQLRTTAFGEGYFNVLADSLYKHRIKYVIFFNEWILEIEILCVEFGSWGGGTFIEILWLQFNVYLRIKVTDPTIPHMSTTLHGHISPGIHHSCHAACVLYFLWHYPFKIIPSKFSGYLNQTLMITKGLGEGIKAHSALPCGLL